MQIDKSKIGKRKYHRVHVVEGLCIFGGIDEDSRKWFINTVEDLSEATLSKSGTNRELQLFLIAGKLISTLRSMATFV